MSSENSKAVEQAKAQDAQLQDILNMSLEDIRNNRPLYLNCFIKWQESVFFDETNEGMNKADKDNLRFAMKNILDIINCA